MDFVGAKPDGSVYEGYRPSRKVEGNPPDLFGGSLVGPESTER